eukprot:scaffold288545_cov54-Attheya_sp.AAC.1
MLLLINNGVTNSVYSSFDPSTFLIGIGEWLDPRDSPIPPCGRTSTRALTTFGWTDDVTDCVNLNFLLTAVTTHNDDQRRSHNRTRMTSYCCWRFCQGEKRL